MGLKKYLIVDTLTILTVVAYLLMDVEGLHGSELSLFDIIELAITSVLQKA